MKSINDKINNLNINTTEIGDSHIFINDKEYYPLKITNVLKANSKDEPGMLPSGKTTAAKEFSNHKKQNHNNWLLVDLETGGRGIYPGCKRFGKTNNNLVEMHESKNDTSPVILQLFGGNIEVEILDRFDLHDGNPFWYLCEFNVDNTSVQGFIRREFIKDEKYI